MNSSQITTSPPTEHPVAVSVQQSTRSQRLAAQTAETNLDQSFFHCRQVTKSRARNFYYGLRLTPEPKRSAIYAIYSWMRDGDDRVDSAPSPAQAARELARFTDLTDLALAGDPHPELTTGFWPAFTNTVARYRIERSIIDAMLSGLAEDLAPAPYQNDDELGNYCYSVASTAGLCCLRIWGLREPLTGNPAMHKLADTKAIARGKAFQLTNILRDIAEDFDASPARCYIPIDALARHKISPQELRS